MNRRLLLAGALLVTISSCKMEDNQIVSSEKLELYKVEDDNGEMKEGPISFSEIHFYNEKEQEVEHHVFNAGSDLPHKEYFKFENGKAIKSEYFSTDDQLMSYYTYQYNDSGLVSEKHSFDASNDELLRIEEFEYNEKDQLLKQLVREANGQLFRTMAFSYDTNGNETQTTIRDGLGNILVNEEYRITKYDDQKRWTEKWSFFNDQPISLRKRSFDRVSKSK